MPLATEDLNPTTLVSPKSIIPSPDARFERLIRDIQAELGPDDGIVSSKPLQARLESLLEDYRSEEEAWSKFAFKDTSQAFTRNLVDKGNGNYNLVRLTTNLKRKFRKLTHL